MLNASKTNKTNPKKEGWTQTVSHVKIIFDAKQRRLPTTKMCIGGVGTHSTRQV